MNVQPIASRANSAIEAAVLASEPYGFADRQCGRTDFQLASASDSVASARGIDDDF